MVPPTVFFPPVRPPMATPLPELPRSASPWGSVPMKLPTILLPLVPGSIRMPFPSKRFMISPLTALFGALFLISNPAANCPASVPSTSMSRFALLP